MNGRDELAFTSPSDLKISLGPRDVPRDFFRSQKNLLIVGDVQTNKFLLSALYGYSIASITIPCIHTAFICQSSSIVHVIVAVPNCLPKLLLVLGLCCQTFLLSHVSAMVGTSSTMTTTDTRAGCRTRRGTGSWTRRMRNIIRA